MEFLKENAEYFEKKAVEALKEKPRFVLFFAEQAIQLYIKYPNNSNDGQAHE